MQPSTNSFNPYSFIGFVSRRWFTLIYSNSVFVFGWTLATKAYLYYNILTVYLNYILSKVVSSSKQISIAKMIN